MEGGKAMRSFVIDVEAVPMAADILAAKLPEDLRNPVMPESIANPEQPNFQEGCPAYASIKDLETRAQKRQAWIDTKRSQWEAKAQDARQKWELAVVEGKSKFAERAALDARLGHAKLIGMKDVEANVSTVWVWEDDPKQMSRIRAWLASLPMHEQELGVYAFQDGFIEIFPFMKEADMLTHFFAEFKDAMTGDVFDTGTSEGQCVTYYGNTFDFPFLYRRAWLLGIPQAPLYRRGRYWDESRMVDLCDCWKMGDREEKTGGLDNVAAALGYDRAKLHDGASFHRFYQEDPSEGLAYLLGDLDMSEFVARKLGVIR